MSSPKYSKNNLIRIYYEDGGGTKKTYIHSKDTYLHAYVRQLSALEQVSAAAVQDPSDIEFVINFRRVRVDMFVEFKGKTYQISGVDHYDFVPVEVKFRAYEVNTRQYAEEEWS